MPPLLPFRGFRYAPERVGKLHQVLALPYDQITPELRRAYATKSPYSIVHLTLPQAEGEGDAYLQAASRLRSWLDAGILTPDPQPAFYLHEQSYLRPGQGRRSRLGLFGLLKLEPPGGTIHPHERTFSVFREDRIRLLETTQANLEPVFMLALDAEGHLLEVLRQATTGVPPLVETDEAFTGHHRLWALTEPGAIQQFQSLLKEMALVVADGHHRYEAALAYQAARRRAEATPQELKPYDMRLAVVVSSADPGLTILPTHRLIKSLPEIPDEAALISRLLEECDARPIPLETRHQAFAALAELKEQAPAFLAVHRPVHRFWLLRPKESFPEPRPLDVAILHQQIIRQRLRVPEETEKDLITFEREPEELLRRVRLGEAQLGIFLNPVTLGEVLREALSGRVLPQKTTDFSPKLPSGLVLRLFELV